MTPSPSRPPGRAARTPSGVLRPDKGIEDAGLPARALLERGENLREAYDNLRYLALNRGRPAEALEWRRQGFEHGIGVQQAPLVSAFDALFWDGDSTVALEAVREAAATGRPDARSAVDRLDSLSAVGLPSSWELLAAANLVVAKLLESEGRLDRALAAVPRRSYAVDRGEVALSTFFRAEGRLALAVGDTAGAIRAYEAYLNLRSDPEPSLAPEADSVRSRLARLEASPGPRARRRSNADQPEAAPPR